jgi:stage III sporulation protein AB
MLIKLVTSSVIVVGCTLLGIAYANRFSQRTQLLQQFQAGLQQLETHILYTAMPLPEAFFHAGRSIGGNVGAFFMTLSDEIHNKRGAPFEKIWKETFHSVEGFAFLNQEDYELFEQMAPGLGMTDRENQKKNFALVQYRLKDQIKKAEGERSRNESLYRNLGILGGLMIAILLF